MKFICPITTLKFVGTISLGLLTGISYTTSSLVLPSLALLPSAISAKSTLAHIQTTATRQILTLASISSISLLTAYSLASPRGKHPYLLWVALMSFLGGQGVEFYYNGLERFYLLGGGSSSSNASSTSKASKSSSSSSTSTSSSTYYSRTSTKSSGGNDSLRESGYIDVDGSGEIVDDSGAVNIVNGEKVEVEMNREKKTQGVRTIVAGLGFLMGVVGIWGDGV